MATNYLAPVLIKFLRFGKEIPLRMKNIELGNYKIAFWKYAFYADVPLFVNI